MVKKTSPAGGSKDPHDDSPAESGQGLETLPTKRNAVAVEHTFDLPCEAKITNKGQSQFGR